MSRRILLQLFCLTLVTTACGHSDDPTRSILMATAPSLEAAPSAVAQAPGERYPLELGTRWEYAFVDSQRFRANGDAEFGPWKTTHGRVTSEASRTTEIEGHLYTVIDELIYFPSLWAPGVPYRDRQFLRQDASALYSFPNAGGIGAPGGAAGEIPTPTFHESVLLVYPPRVGARWKVRLRSDYEFEVEAIEPVRTVLGVFPAARVRGFLHSGQPGTEPDLTWYGKPGVLRQRSKRMDDAGLPNGQRGIRETISERLLTSFVPG